jgi:Tol biopolymer transport system component
VSADGSRVAFDSFATNFAPNDDNNNSDVFVRDRATGTTQLVSVSMGGGPGDDGSSVSVGALTRDGFEITFTSSATNLIPGDDNSFADVFVADLRTGAIRRVSVDSAGAQLAAPSGPPAVVSSNGAYVAFRTRAGIAATDTNLRDDVYVAPNPPPRVAELVSVGAGNPSNGVSDGRPSVSYDGRWIAFTTSASNFAVGDGNGVTDVYVRDRGAGTTRLVSVSAQGNAAGDGPSHSPSLSADGRFVAFVSGATNLVDGDANAVEDVFLRDLWRERTVRVSAPAGGTEANAASGEPSVCGAGVCVLFVSRATNLVQGTTSARARVYAFDPRTAELTLVSRAVDGGDPDDDSRSPSVSGDGRFVAFESSATNLVAGDTNGWPDIFVRDRVAGTTTRVSVATDGREADAPCISPALSLDGRFVVFATHATLEAPDNNGRLDLYLHDRSDGSTIRVTNGVVGASNGDSDLPSISGDGRFVLFSSGAPNLVAGDTNGVADVFVFERLSRAIVRVSETLLRQASSPSRENHLSGDGFALVFSTAADGLVPGDTNALSDIVAVVNPLY